jgi:hypothetical protein
MLEISEGGGEEDGEGGDGEEDDDSADATTFMSPKCKISSRCCSFCPDSDSAAAGAAVARTMLRACKRRRFRARMPPVSLLQVPSGAVASSPSPSAASPPAGATAAAAVAAVSSSLPSCKPRPVCQRSNHKQAFNRTFHPSAYLRNRGPKA